MKTILVATIICLAVLLSFLACSDNSSNVNSNSANANNVNAVGNSNVNSNYANSNNVNAVSGGSSATSGERASRNVTASERTKPPISISISESARNLTSGCSEITCSHVTSERFNCIKSEAKRYGLNIGASSGSLSTTAYTANYNWNSGTHILTMNVTKKPDNISCNQLIGLCGVVSSNCSD